jgi:hypothetical protein
MKKLILLCAFTVAAMAAPAAKADDFQISFDGGSLGYSGLGVFTGNWDATADGYDITSVISGFVVDPGFGFSDITGLSTYAGPDQVLYFPSAPYFDSNGLSFALANGVDINLYDTIAGPFYFDSALQSNPNGDIPEDATFSVLDTSITPEPSSFVLLGSAMLLGAALLMRRPAIL